MIHNPPPFPQPPSPSDDLIARHLQGIQYPLTLSFKILAIASQITVTDATGRPIVFTRQKIFKFREHVEVFTDSTQTTLLANIRANKVIDWSARYFATTPNDSPIGSVGRRGWRSLWKAQYEVFNPGDDSPDFSIREENPWSKVADSLLGQIPLLGLATGYLFHPRYLATRSNGQPAIRLTKLAAFFEGRFQIEQVGDLTPNEELNLFLSFLMLVLLERNRG